MNPQTLSFSVAFNYSALARTSRGVFVQVTLASGVASTWDINVRIDSASSYSVFGRQWTDALGLEWDSGDPLTIATATGTFQARLHEVTISLLDFEWTAAVAFAEWETAPRSYARDVLGLTGFFDRFLVAIDDASETVYLEPRF
jgi:hypothetical protein